MLHFRCKNEFSRRLPKGKGDLGITDALLWDYLPFVDIPCACVHRNYLSLLRRKRLIVCSRRRLWRSWRVTTMIISPQVAQYIKFDPNILRVILSKFHEEEEKEIVKMKKRWFKRLLSKGPLQKAGNCLHCCLNTSNQSRKNRCKGPRRRGKLLTILMSVFTV